MLIRSNMEPLLHVAVSQVAEMNKTIPTEASIILPYTPTAFTDTN